MVGTSFRDWCRYFQYNEGSKDEEDKERNKAEARNALLIVATLIAAVTFQAGVNPPGGVWQETKGNHWAGTAICASESSAYYVFLTSNTLAFSSAVLLIMSLTHKFPFKFELRVASVSMIITYGASVFSVTGGDKITTFRFILIVAAAPLVMRCLIQLFVPLINSEEAEGSCLIQAFSRPKNKTTDRALSDLGDQSLHA